MPCLVLTYTFVDSLAWLIFGPEEKSSKKRFIKWVDKYFLPHFDARCSAIDLYASRCATLHGLSWESHLTQTRKAKVLLFYSSDDKKGVEEAAAAVFSTDHAIMLSIDTLLQAMRGSYADFLAHMESDEGLRRRVEVRLGKRCVSLTPDQFKRLASAMKNLSSSNLKQQPTAGSGG